MRVRAFEAARRGCEQGDIAWFPQMSLMAAPGLPLSYSSALASPECVASGVLGSIFTCMELCLCDICMDSAGVLRSAAACALNSGMQLLCQVHCL